jgi:hypothetical protein
MMLKNIVGESSQVKILEEMAMRTVGDQGGKSLSYVIIVKSCKGVVHLG